MQVKRLLWASVGAGVIAGCCLMKGGDVVLTGENAEVVIAPKASPVVRFAAAEMTNFLSQAFGRVVPLVNVPTPGKASVVLGMNEWAAAAGLSTNALSRDAFTVAAKDGKVFILGRDCAKTDPAYVLTCGGWGSVLFERATLFGVYDFLDREAGVRFYFPGELGTIVPKADRIAVSGARTVKPDFMQRFLQIWSGEYFEPDPKNVNKTLDYMRLRFETIRPPACHGSTLFMYQRRFGKTHPEYFALLPSGTRDTSETRGSEGVQPGQLCWSSGIVEEMYEDAKSYLKGEGPEVRGIPSRYMKGKLGWNGNCAYGKYVDLMPQDGMILCGCPKCQASAAACRARGLPEETDLIWGAVSNIATRLTAEGFDAIVSMMAYNGYGAVPDYALPSNITVMAAVTGPWSMENPKLLESTNRKVISWAKKLGHPIRLWNYPGKYLGMDVKAKDVPEVCPRAWVAYYRQIAPYAEGAFAESDTDRWFFNYLNYYVFSKVCWDNDVDADALLAEHDRLMFGPAAAEMAEIYRTLEQCWMKGVVGNVVETPMGPVVRPPSDKDMWEKVYSPAKRARFGELVRKALGKVAPGSLEARRIALVKREYLDRLNAAAGRYEKMAAGLAALQFELGVGETHTLALVPFTAGRTKLRATVRTEVAVKRTADALVVTFDCEEPFMDRRAVRTHEPDDPNLWQDDVVEVVIDPIGDKTTYYQAFVNSEGSWADMLESRIHMPQPGFKFNAGLTAKVTKHEKSWTAEVTIPLKAFPKLPKVLTVEFARERNLTSGEAFEHLYHWSPYAYGFSALENLGRIILK